MPLWIVREKYMEKPRGDQERWNGGAAGGHVSVKDELFRKTLRQTLDSGRSLANPDGLLINGQAHTTFNGDQG
ncbi:L-ascorbate oxidase-like protein [Senna tora]|uniref:L-ascorbate oxidase-like protein n=1 Tax=Senna tora TaxID=362788 RepID=A0A834TWE2_9FABA|nr:L-ascorbate oxidase-like protein [Senna tora]